jgi:HSP20 family molecular chaperone IbpA
MKDVKIEVDEARRIVHVNVNKDESKETDDTDVFGRRVHRSERFTGSGYRSIRLPANADVNAVKANLVNGLLTIEVQKSERTPGFKRIDIGSGQGSLQDVPQQGATQRR